MILPEKQKQLSNIHELADLWIKHTVTLMQFSALFVLLQPELQQ